MQQPVKTKIHYNEINLLRGFAVLIIVLVHSSPNAEFSLPDKVHFLPNCLMSVFFMVSGFVNAGKFCGDSGFGANAKKQVRHLLVPYLIYSFIAYALKALTNQMNGDTFLGIFMGDSPNVVLWFIWVLFVAGEFSLLLGYCFSKANVKRRETVFLVLGIAFYVLTLFLDLGFLEKVCACFLYFYAGVFVRTHYERFKKIITDKIVAAVLLVLFTTLYIVCEEPVLPFQLVGIAFIWLVFLVIAEYLKGSLFYTFFDKLGTHSFEIYLWSYFVQVASRIVFVNVLHMTEILAFVLIFITGLSVPYVLSVLAKKYHLTLR